MTTATDTQISYLPVRSGEGTPLKLAMQRLWLRGRLLPIGAHLFVHHVFRSSEVEPVEVVYCFALPRDAALRRFFVRGAGFSIRSELKRVEEAIRQYEDGVLEGRLSTLARQYRDGLVNLTLGNLRPNETVTVILEIVAGVEVRDDGWRFRFPFTVAPCYHPRALMAEPSPGVGEIQLPEKEFGDLLLPQWHEDASVLHGVGFDLWVESPVELKSVASPSHALSVRFVKKRGARIQLALAQDVPNRDLIVEARTHREFLGVFGGKAPDERSYFAAVIPSAVFGKPGKSSRRVVFVLDTSGSMGGPPIQHAVRACEAMIGLLTEDDEFGMVAFANGVRKFRGELVRATAAVREQALSFLRGLRAGGGTELLRGIRAGLELLCGQGDLLLITDGQVFGTEDIVSKLAASTVRIHCLGIGSASQDRFLSSLSRMTGGVSRFLSPRERVDSAAIELFASTTCPVATDLRVTSTDTRLLVSPKPPARLYPGTPLVIFASGLADSGSVLKISWRAGDEQKRLSLPVRNGAGRDGEIVKLLQGARLITDCETRLASVTPSDSRTERQFKRLELLLERFSQAYGLASRRMALVAVIQREGDEPGQIPKTQVVPVGLPESISFESYFAHRPRREQLLETAISHMECSLRTMRPSVPLRGLAEVLAKEAASLHPAAAETLGLRKPDLRSQISRIESDGGLPGKSLEERTLASVLLLLALVQAGNTLREGPLQTRVRQLVDFLTEASKGLPERLQRIVAEVLRRVSAGERIRGPWGYLLERLDETDADKVWAEIEKRLGPLFQLWTLMSMIRGWQQRG